MRGKMKYCFIKTNYSSTNMIVKHYFIKRTVSKATLHAPSPSSYPSETSSDNQRVQLQAYGPCRCVNMKVYSPSKYVIRLGFSSLEYVTSFA